MKQDHILVVDDDTELRSLLGEYLGQAGFRVTAAADGRQMARALDSARFDLVILDVMLPDEDGLSLCRRLRAGSRIPILMLTARGDEVDRIIGLEMGADDYLPKPFNPRELLARVKSILRRAGCLPENLADEDVRRFRFQDWTLDTQTRQMLSPAGVVVDLSGAEYKLLRVLLEHANRVLSRDQILEFTQGREASAFDRAIDVQIGRLRRKLGDDPREPRLIKTVRNEGYVLAVPVVRQ
ncbi:response regulator [Parasulfuritortus cantonensis]|uniref:Response regulator n=1 Tax=Parasulfuritortus cantonensis TaxID=2528202 RepID=A0A4R1BF93_9PROT|nr:response regulator [Parasulfuritortus cantonensis]TCJ15819.1 response regulator [Parasulfuritortus cantonensis]